MIDDSEDPKVPFARRGSIVDEHDLIALSELVHSDAPLSQGIRREQFEERFRRFIGSRHALSVTSATVALQLAIHLLDLAPGDEVIVTPQTYQATGQPLLDYDVTVRFCDVEPGSLNIDPDALEALITDRTRGVILVHYGGFSCDADRILALTRPRGIVVIEDCAHALGSRYFGRRPGSLADIGCFSFHTTKNITTLGEGGMITFERDEWRERLDRLRSNEVDAVFTPRADRNMVEPVALPWMKYSQGVYRQNCAEVRRAGTNATMSEAAAAVGLVQMDKLPDLVATRRSIAIRLNEVVRGALGTRTLEPPPHIEHSWHLYTFLIEGAGRRDRLVQQLHRRGVEIQLRYFPLHLLPEWRARGHVQGECPIAERLWFTEQVNLPCHPGLSEGQIRHMVDALDESLAELPQSAGDRPLQARP